MRDADELRVLAEDYLAALPFAVELGKLEEALRYSLLGGGKRIRPVLCLATGEALGRGPEELLPAACSLELVHTFSLVHDDLPALDDDDLRRGQPSAHVRFGEGVAVLAGDALLAEALRLALSYDTPDVARLLADATLGMIGGQYPDVTHDGETDAADLCRLHALKTGRLLEASVVAATAVAGLPVEERAGWAAFGRELGLLFQVVDDVLDATGTAAELGKTPGKDDAAGKTTYVSLYGVERARELAEEARRSARARLDDLPAETRVLEQLADAIAARAT
jgi:geranylgeranyl diphosphate synthase type II